MYIGSTLSGAAVDYYTRKAGEVVTRDWQGFWLSSSMGAFVILLMIALFFRSNAKVQPAEAPAS
jgi:hypothetical protein